jgi:tetratricopeptide (TPR) repeat protein
MHGGHRGISGLCLAALTGAVVALCAPARAQDATQLNALGVERYEDHDWAGAATQFDAALRLDPNNATVRRNLTNSLQAQAADLAQGADYANAIAKLRQAVQNDPDNAMPLLQIGAYYLHEGQVRDAIFRLEEAVELAPENSDAHYLLGEAYYRDNDAVSALEQWNWVERVEPRREGLAERLEAARRDEKAEANFRDRSSTHFNVTYNREAEGQLVRQVVDILETAYREVGQALGQSYPPTPIQVSLYTNGEFIEATQMKEHVGAVYDGTKIRCPVIGPDGKPLAAEEMRRRLHHEYVHVVVRHIAREGVPWWLNEGLAEELTVEPSEENLRYLRKALDDGALFNLRDLTEGQLDRLDKDQLFLAYRQSHATVAYLRQRYGTRRLAQLLREFAAGADAETAVRRVFRQSYTTLQMAAADYIRNG